MNKIATYTMILEESELWDRESLLKLAEETTPKRMAALDKNRMLTSAAAALPFGSVVFAPVVAEKGKKLRSAGGALAGGLVGRTVGSGLGALAGQRGVIAGNTLGAIPGKMIGAYLGHGGSSY